MRLNHVVTSTKYSKKKIFRTLSKEATARAAQVRVVTNQASGSEDPRRAGGEGGVMLRVLIRYIRGNESLKVLVQGSITAAQKVPIFTF